MYEQARGNPQTRKYGAGWFSWLFGSGDEPKYFTTMEEQQLYEQPMEYIPLRTRAERARALQEGEIEGPEKLFKEGQDFGNSADGLIQGFMVPVGPKDHVHGIFDNEPTRRNALKKKKKLIKLL